MFVYKKQSEYINQSKKDITAAPKVYLRDCNDFLDRYKDDSIDFIIPDTPYLTDVKEIRSFAEKNVAPF